MQFASPKTEIQDDSAAKPQPINEQPTRLQLDTKSMLEMMYSLPYPKKSTDKLSAKEKTALQIIDASEMDYVSFQAIRTSRHWGLEKPRTAELRELLQGMILDGFIEGDEEKGYTAF